MATGGRGKGRVSVGMEHNRNHWRSSTTKLNYKDEALSADQAPMPDSTAKGPRLPFHHCADAKDESRGYSRVLERLKRDVGRPWSSKLIGLSVSFNRGVQQDVTKRMDGMKQGTIPAGYVVH